MSLGSDPLNHQEGGVDFMSELETNFDEFLKPRYIFFQSLSGRNLFSCTCVNACVPESEPEYFFGLGMGREFFSIPKPCQPLKNFQGRMVGRYFFLSICRLIFLCQYIYQN